MNIAFLSYSTRDGVLGPRALEEIAHALQGAHDQVYVDLLHNRDPQPQEHLEHVLRSSTTLYLVQTPATSWSRWVRRGIGAGTNAWVST